MAESNNPPLIDRLSLEREFDYTPPEVPAPLPNVPYRDVELPSPKIIGTGEQTREEKDPLIAYRNSLQVNKKSDGRLTGGSIMRTLAESTSARYDNFVPGGYNNEDAYAQGQSWTDRMVNGVGKGILLTGTTFLQNTVGLANGLIRWNQDGKFASFYNNDLNRWVDGITRKAEDILPNYETDVEKNAAWYSPKYLFTANFLWNGVVKNMGYAAGSALSGAAFASMLKAIPLTSRLFSVGKAAESLAATEAGLLGANKVADTYGRIKSLSDKFLTSYKIMNPGGRAVVAGLSTSGEAGMEAFQNMNAYRDSKIDEFKQRNQGREPIGEELEAINRDAESIGNVSYLLNTGLLFVTNFIQFPKILGSSYKLEKGILKSLTRETEEIVKDASGKYIKKEATTRAGKLLSRVNNIRPYVFSASEAFEEGAQYAIGVGVENYYNKKNDGKPTTFLDSLVYGIENTLGTDEGMKNVIIGGLSGSLMQARGTFGERAQRQRNTSEALKAFKQYNISDFVKETADSVNRGTVLQEEREKRLRQGDILESKDLEADYIINYLTPRIKFGRYDLVAADIAEYKALASTDEGFAQLQSEGKALDSDTKEMYLKRLANLESTANNIKSLYQSLNLRYAGLVDEDGDPLYSPAVIDKMIYAATKVTDYDKRTAELSSNLLDRGVVVENVINDVVSGESVAFNEAMTKIEDLHKYGEINDDQKEDLLRDLKDISEMALRRQMFMKEYDEIKKSPENYKEVPFEEEEDISEPAEEEGKKEVKEKIKVKTKDGERELEVDTQYFVGKGVDYDKDGLEVPIDISSLTILGENEDGTIKIRDNKGQIRDISKEVLENYKLGKMSYLRSNKTANYFYRHRNEMFEYNFGKKYGGKKPGRLEYQKGKLFFVYKDDKGKIRRKQLKNEDFIAQPGYDQARIKKVGEVETAEQKIAREEFTSAEEIAKQKETLAKNRDARLEIITQLENETRERLEQVSKKLENKKKELDGIQKDLDEIGGDVKVAEPRTKREKALEAKYPELSRQKARFSKVLSTTSKALTKLSRMREDVQNEIDSLTAEKNELELNLSYFEDFSQNLDELPENSGQFLNELKQQVKWIDALIKETGDNINVLAKMAKDIESAIKEFVSLLQSSLQKFDADYPSYIKDSMERMKENPIFSEVKTLKEYLVDYALLEDLNKDISVNENQLEDVNNEIKNLYKTLDELGAEYNAKKQILDRFQAVADAYQIRKDEENKLIKNEQLLAEALGTADTSVQTAEFNKEYEPTAKKSDEIIPRATMGVVRGKAHQIRANIFGFNLNRFKNRKNIRGIYVTSKNEDQFVPGLTDRLRMDEAGQINEDIKKDEIIAMVMVEEDAEGNIQLVGEDGQPIPEGVDPLDYAIYQVYPDGNLRWGAEFNNESMFRKDTPQEVRDSIVKQYKQWRTSILENPDAASQLHQIEASFGRLENVTDADGKIIYDTRTSVQDGNLITEDELESTQLITIPTLPTQDGKFAVVTKGTVSFIVPIGTVLLETPNGLIKLQNRKHTEKEAEVIYDTILQLAKNMLNPQVGIKSPESARLLKWLKSVVYWGIPEDREGKRKPAGYNSVFFEKDAETGRFMLSISGKGKDFAFTPTSLEENKEAIITLLSNMYNNVNSHMSQQLNESYEEILSISDKGEITSKTWQNYQSYLLSNKTPDGKKRSSEELPLSTTAKPVTTAEEVNRTNIYFYTTDTADDFVISIIEKKKVVTPKVLTPGAPKPQAAPVSTGVNKTKEQLQKELETLIKKQQEAFDKKDQTAYLDAQIKINKIGEELAALEGAKTVTAAPAPAAPVPTQTFILDGKTPNTYISPKRKKIRFVALPTASPTNLDAIQVLAGEDFEEVRDGLKAAGRDPKFEIRMTIYKEIEPFLASAKQDEEDVAIEIPDDVQEVVVADAESQMGSAIDDDIIDAVNEKISGADNEALRAIIEEELKAFVPENWNQVETWLKANFPNVPVYRVKNIIQATNGRQAWGMFKDGAIYIYENAEVGTVYHEVFHAVWRMFSDPAEQKAVLDEMRARSGKFFDRDSLKDVSYSEATEKQLEEKLAEEFRDYVQNKKIPVKPTKGRPYILKLFADMVTAIKEFFLGPQSDSKVNKMFSKIGQGYYKSHLPLANNLAFAKKGIVDIEDAFADSDAVLSLVGINDRERSDIVQHMTYLTLLDFIKKDKSLFEVEKLNKKEQYAKLKYEIYRTIAQKARAAQSLVREGKKTQAEVNPFISNVLQLMQNVKNQWDLIVERHEEHLKSYQIEFDENDNLILNDENNSGRETYQDATKIDNFKKANSAIKLLLATIPEVNSEGKLVPSSIGGAKLIPVGKTYISVMNNLHTSLNLDDMLNRLRNMAVSDPNYRTLYKRITKRNWNEPGVDLSRVDTEHGLQLLSSMWNTFKKQAPDVKNVFILENGDIVVGEANLSTAAQKLRSEYINSIVFKAKEGKGFFKYDEKEKAFKGDPGKLKGITLSSITSMVEFLDEMGISFTVPEVQKLNATQYETFKDAVLGIKQSLSNTEKIVTFSGKALNIHGRLLQLGLVKAVIANPEFSSTYFNVSGERTQSYIGTNAVSDFYDFFSKLERFNKDTVGGTRYSYLLTDSFAKGSNLLKRTFSKTGTRKEKTEDLFKIGYVGGMVDEGKGKRKESSRLTYRDRLIQELNLNLDGWYLNLVPGDASLEWMIKLGNAISVDSIGRGMGDINAIFKEYFLSELELVRENRPVAKGRKSGEMRFFKGILANPDGKTEKEKNKLHDDIIATEGTPEEVYKRFEDKINQKLESFMREDMRKLKIALSQFGILKEGMLGIELQNVNIPNNLSQRELDNHLLAMTANYMISNIEMHKLLYSDPYQYEDELKRIKSFNSPRQAIISGSKKMNAAFNNVWNKDYKTGDIGNTKFTQDYFRSATHADVIGIIDLPNYKEFKETDGSGIISMKANRHFRIRAGQWNSDEERQYKYDVAWEKRDKGLELSPKEESLLAAGNPGVQSAYTPLKPIVSGSRLGKDGLPNSYNDVVLDKFALYPLSYRILKEIGKDVNAIKLYNKMQKEDIDYVVFESGRKVGARAENLHETYKNGEFNNDPYKGVINVPFSIMSIQSEVPSKEDNLVTRGSQITKLITLDFLEAGVPVDFFPGQPFPNRYKAWARLSDDEKFERSKLYKEIKNNQDLLEALIEVGYKTTLNRLGIKEIVTKEGKKYEIVDFSKAAETLRDEILKRETNDNISDALAGFLQGKVVLEATPAYQQIRNIIYSIADKQFISPKISGGLKVQIPSTLLESGTRKVKDGVYESDVLKFYEKDGERIAEVMVGRWFDSPLSDEELLDLWYEKDANGNRTTKLTEEGKKILSGVGYRIPTQKQNSIDKIVIKKFLPKEFRDSVVIPAALVQKVGSDFDIDKLSVYLKNVYINKKGEPKLIKFLDDSNSTVQERYIKWVKENAERDTKRYIRFLTRSQIQNLRTNYEIEKAKLKADIKDTLKEMSNQSFETMRDRIASERQDKLILQDSYMKELFEQGSEIFWSLSKNIIDEFLLLRDEIRIKGIKGPEEIRLYMTFAQGMLSTRKNLRSEDKKKLTYMVSLYQQELKVLGATNEIIEKINEEALKSFREEKQIDYKSVMEVSVSSFINLDELYDEAKTEQDLEAAEEIARFDNLPSIEDFAKFSIKNQNIKAALENAYIESMENLITNDANYKNLIKPNSADPLKKLANEIAEKTVGQTFDYKNVDNMLDRTFMSRLRHAFVTGKYAIGIAAVNQTNHSLNQRQPIYIDKNKLSRVSEEDLFWLGNNVDIKFDKFNAIEIDGEMVPTLSMIQNKAGEYISDIIGMFIDGYVDISKGPWIMELGATPNVASTWLFLTKLGVPINTVAYFMNQPIIRDYLRTIESAGYSWLFIDQFVNDMSDIYEQDMTEIELNEKLETFRIPRETALRENLGKRPSDMNSQQKMEQFLILKEFLKYAKMAEHMFHVTQGSNYDTAAFNDPYLVFKKQMQQIKAQNTIISSVDTLLANSFVGKLAENINSVRNAFAEILKSDSPKVRNVIQNVLMPYVNMNDRDFVKMAQKAVNDLFDWAVQTDESQNLNKMITDILINDDNVGRQVTMFVNEVKEKPNHPLRKNQIIEIIEGIPSFRAAAGGPNNVKLNMAEKRVYDQNNVISAFRELRDYLKGEKNPLYDRIVVLSILQSGLSTSPISFTSLLPYEDFENVYNQTLSKLEGMSNLEDFYKLGVFQRNNWSDDDVVPYLRASLITSKKTGRKHYNPSMKFLPDPVKDAITDGKIPPVLTRSKFNREANSDYIVYTWEKQEDVLSKDELNAALAKGGGEIYRAITAKKTAMRKAGDFSFINKGLFRKVYDDYGVPLEHTDYEGNKYFVYKAINAWGDSYRANEFWATDHKSVIENGFMKVEDVDNNVIISKFLQDPKTYKKQASTPTAPAAPTGKTEFDKLPAKSGISTMTYAGIGSREAPVEVLKQMTEVAKYLEGIGYTLNTGKTYPAKPSSDPKYQAQYEERLAFSKKHNGKVGLDEEGADRAFSLGATKKNLFYPGKQGSRAKEQTIAKEIHPNPEALSQGALKLMARNTNQIFGDNLDTPVDFVLFYAKETGGIRPQGGTGQAVEMARRKGIPTINMANPNWRQLLQDVISKPTAPTAPVSKIVANIPQNKVSGVESYGSLVTAAPNVIAALGSSPYSIDMIEAGFRTRTTRSADEMAKYNVKVGDIIKHFGKSADGTTKEILARVTAIHPKGSAGWKGTWAKEGWKMEDVNIIDRFKDGAAAIEFEVIKPTTITLKDDKTYNVSDVNTKMLTSMGYSLEEAGKIIKQIC